MRLHEPEHRLLLGMNAEIGEFLALQQQKKSLESKIARALRGIPSAGGKCSYPVGRVFDKTSETWTLDEAVAKVWREIAARFLKGESLYTLGQEFRIAYSSVCKNLRHRMGSAWEQHFDSDELNIHEVVVTSIPPILDDKTIKQIHARLDACKTFLHPPPLTKHDYLLRGFIFCAGCSRALTGTKNREGKRYYRHAHNPYVLRKPQEPCPYAGEGPSYVRADDIEKAVIRELARLYGNPAAIKRAVEDAMPDQAETRARIDRLEADLGKLDRARGRILDLVEREALTTAEAEGKLKDIRGRQDTLAGELAALRETLAAVPSAEQVRRFIERSPDGSVFWITDDDGNVYAGGNDVASIHYLMERHNRADQRRLLESVFTEPGSGVHLVMEDVWTYTIRGMLNIEITAELEQRVRSTPP